MKDPKEVAQRGMEAFLYHVSFCEDENGNDALRKIITHHSQAIEMIDQNPIGRSSRSNPATYVKAYDDIRQLYAEQPISKLRSYKPGYFSFNIEGGRCEDC